MRRTMEGPVAQTLGSVLAVALFAAFMPFNASVATAGEESCNGHMRMVFLSTKPLRVNPGKCRYFRINLWVALQAPATKPPQICLYGKSAGSAKEYGPFCSDGANFGVAVPGALEWLWSNRGVEAGLKFCKSPVDCR